MKLFVKIPMLIFIAINILVIVAMNFCAYTSWLPPQTYPNWSYFGLMFPVFLAADILFVLFWLIFKWKLAAIPLVGMLLCAWAVRTYLPFNFPFDPPEGSIKVLSYNVMAFGKDKSADIKENEIVKYVQSSGADIVCLQEATQGGYKIVMDYWKEKYPYQHVDDMTNNFHIILSKYPILSTSEIKYESTSNYSFVYELKVGDDTLVVINNHLESYKLSSDDKDVYKELVKNPEEFVTKSETVGDEASAEEKYGGLTAKLAKANAIRGAQTDSVAAVVERNRGRYIVVCGDFNDPTISYTHHRLVKELDDAFTRSGNGPGISYNRSGMYFRIDNILVSPNIKAYGAKVDNQIKISDHYPISCYIKLCTK